MRPKSILLLALALGCGLVASIGISQVMDRKVVQPAPLETEPILVALQDINLAEPLTADMLKLEEWPKDKIAPDALRQLDEVIGRRSRTKIYSGEPIREAKLISADGSDTPSEQIAKGYRVVSVRVDAATGVSGLVKPGDRVDVQLFVSRSDRHGIAQTKVKTILEDVKIFAVDQAFRRTAEGEDGAQVARTISLAVTPKQAETLNLATELGKICLTIRHPDDDTDVSPTETTTEDLFVGDKANRDAESESAASDDVRSFLENLNGDEQAAAPAEAAPATRIAAAPLNFVMQIFEGSSAREVEFSDDGRLPQSSRSGGAAPLSPTLPDAGVLSIPPVESEITPLPAEDAFSELNDLKLQ